MLGCLQSLLADDEIRRKANFAYQHIIAQFLLPWNHGLYCANPSRSKGLEKLIYRQYEYESADWTIGMAVLR